MLCTPWLAAGVDSIFLTSAAEASIMARVEARESTRIETGVSVATSVGILHIQ
ncbi:hypothetical protein [Piscirickettsia salmonis]|uniref:hypothetical protein n=1 Tax=Piscirickettsia salmonis TaxID=1238 RepID=UPI003A7FC337